MRCPLAIVLVIASILAPSPSFADRFQDSILGQHNALRARHGSAPLQWSQQLADFAQDWANTLAREDRMRHRPSNRYGENIYWQSNNDVSGAQVVSDWYGEIAQYDYRHPGFSSETGHFTQVVWSGSTGIGCGRALSRRGGLYVVCNYAPAGNVIGRFEQNVVRPR
jgi:uncharacterized protein YkwD